jgi:RNA polymerase sigma-70 factor (ECF subfamily)
MAEAVGMWPRAAADAEATPRTDQELAAQAGAGDARAFEELYRRHNRRVYSLCLRMTQNAAEAEDLTQEVFINLFRKIDMFRGESQFSTWLHRLAVNRVLMHFRKAKSRKDGLTEDGTTPEPAFESGGGQQRTPQLDRLALDRALARLPPGYRAVFILHDIEGYEHEEVGRICGIAPGTSKSQLHKARARLRRLLGETVRG